MFGNTRQRELNYGNVLAHSFSSKVISELSSSGRSDSLSKMLVETKAIDAIPKNTDLKSYYNNLYVQLLNNYRNEYVFKNLIANKILLGRHSLNTSAMLTEFRILNSKADVLFLNGNAHIYEIKTDYDCLDRLEKQLDDYQKFAEYVTVITTKKLSDKTLCTVPSNVGVIELTKKCTFRTIRKAISGIDKISNDIVFDSLRKDEYMESISRNFGACPNVPNTQIRAECKKLFSSLSKIIINEEMMTFMKKRFVTTTSKKFIEDIPSSLKAVAVSGCISNKNNNNFLAALSSKIENIL